jgi:hypothetical protein
VDSAIDAVEREYRHIATGDASLDQQKTGWKGSNLVSGLASSGSFDSVTHDKPCSTPLRMTNLFQSKDLQALAFVDNLERIAVRVEYIGGIISRIVFQPCAG